MAVTTKTQTEQIHTKASSGTESTTPGEQLLRDELKEAAREFTRGCTTLAHELADDVDEIVDEVETDYESSRIFGKPF